MNRRIFTSSGKLIDPFDPSPNLITIEDIANALSNIPRFGGHTPIFYSVANHSINCCISANTSRKDALYMLLHDASEAYLLDIPTPVKIRLPEYLAAEKYMQEIIYRKFVGSLPDREESLLIEQIDAQLLDIEISAFFGRSSRMLDLVCATRRNTPELFLKKFKKLTQ